jgi:hypothetical protein
MFMTLSERFLRGKKMFKISYKDLRGQNFRSALSKLTTCTKLDFKTAYRIAQTAKHLEEAFKKSQKEWVELADPILQRDEKGGFRVDETGFHFKEGIDSSEADKKVKDYLEKEVIIERWKMTAEGLHPAGLSPADYVALAPMLEETP